MTQHSHNQEEIDFYELWQVLLKYKLMILSIILLTTSISGIYAWKAPTMYQGTVLIEIGDVIFNSESSNDKPTIMQTIDNSNAIQAILDADPHKNSIKVEMPRGESNLIRLIYVHEDTKIIQTNLQETVALILKRHQTKANFFQKANALIRPTQVISDITITTEPIKLNQNFIIISGVISGLVIGIFLSFFLEFIIFKNYKKMRSNTSEAE